MISKPDNMLEVSNRVVSSVAKKEREIWTKTKRISGKDSPQVRIVAARIAN